MHKILLASHSGFRYIVMTLLVVALLSAWAAMLNNGKFTNGSKKLYLFTLISAHIQLVIGLVLYFVSPWVQLSNMGATMKDPTLRYWSVEHLTIMILAIVLITIGYSKSKRAVTDVAKHKFVAVFYTLGFIAIVVGILLSQRGFFTMTH